jgi:ABC-2 type transport system ATP-binding protein
MEEQSMTAIHVSHLHKSFEYYKKEAGLRSSLRNLIRREKLSKDAVGDISFDIEAGDIVGFLGPNGAGKTTTLKMLAGILFPSSGDASVLGYVPWERKNEFKRQFSIVMGQKSQLWWDLPANESFYLNKCIYQVDDAQYKKTVSELADYLDVKDLMSVQVRRLSLGERMKMELIACLLHNPKVIYLDEPTIGLDFTSQRKIREFLQFYNRETGATMILTSHYMADVEELCKKTIIISQGNLIYNGELNAIRDRINSRKVVHLKFASPVEDGHFEQYGNVASFDGDSLVIEVEREKVGEHASLLLSQYAVTDFTVEELPLERGIEELYNTNSKH